MCLHISRCHHCHYCNVDYLLFHNVTQYTNSLLSCIHVKIATLLNGMCTLSRHMHVIREVGVYIVSVTIWKYTMLYLCTYNELSYLVKKFVITLLVVCIVHVSREYNHEMLQLVRILFKFAVAMAYLGPT